MTHYTTPASTLHPKDGKRRQVDDYHTEKGFIEPMNYKKLEIENSPAQPDENTRNESNGSNSSGSGSSSSSSSNRNSNSNSNTNSDGNESKNNEEGLSRMVDSNGKLLLTLDEAIDMVPIGKFHYRLLGMTGLTFMADALEVNLLSFISVCAGNTWNLMEAEIASISSVVFVGIVIGSVFFGIFADRLGRRMGFLLASFIISFFGFLSGASPNYATLITFRAFTGFGVGGVSVAFDLLAEFLPSNARGKFLTYIEYFWTVGAMMVAGIAWAILDTQGWRTLTFLTAIPVTVTCIYSYLYCPESPRWLMIKGRIEEAEKNIRDAAVVNGFVMPPFSLLPEEEKDDCKFVDLVDTEPVRNISLPIWVIWTGFGFTYYGMILFTSRIYEVDTGEDDGICSFDYSAIFVNTAAEAAGVSICALCIDSVGRVNTTVGGYFFAGMFVFMLGMAKSSSAVLALSMISRMFIMSASNSVWVMTPELYDTDTRTLGHATAAALSKAGAFLSPYVVFSSIDTISVSIILFIVNLFSAAVTLLLPETMNRSLGKDNQKPETNANNVPTTSRSRSVSSDQVINPMLEGENGML